MKTKTHIFKISFSTLSLVSISYSLKFDSHHRLTTFAMLRNFDIKSFFHLMFDTFFIN